MASGLFRRYLCCAAGSQGWVIGPVRAQPSLLVVCSPSYSRSIAELRGECRSPSLQHLNCGLGREGVCWWVQRWGWIPGWGFITFLPTWGSARLRLCPLRAALNSCTQPPIFRNWQKVDPRAFALSTQQSCASGISG